MDGMSSAAMRSVCFEYGADGATTEMIGAIGVARAKGRRAPERQQHPKHRQRPKRPPRPMSIAAVCRAAAREGVSYGVYVLRHGV